MERPLARLAHPPRNRPASARPDSAASSAPPTRAARPGCAPHRSPDRTAARSRPAPRARGEPHLRDRLRERRHRLEQRRRLRRRHGERYPIEEPEVERRRGRVLAPEPPLRACVFEPVEAVAGVRRLLRQPEVDEDRPSQPRPQRQRHVYGGVLDGAQRGPQPAEHEGPVRPQRGNIERSGALGEGSGKKKIFSGGPGDRAGAHRPGDPRQCGTSVFQARSSKPRTGYSSPVPLAGSAGVLEGATRCFVACSKA